ncbi:MAG TPA: hypothetical protein VFA66_09315 [Gaiellaceae bacterium]|nr:hypothetical protein [Gaiellaceae bacterium]
MCHVWLAIIAISLGPVVLAGSFANPLVFLVLGPERWREQVSRLHPYRRELLFSIAVCAFATAIYAGTYG